MARRIRSPENNQDGDGFDNKPVLFAVEKTVEDSLRKKIVSGETIQTRLQKTSYVLEVRHFSSPDTTDDNMLTKISIGVTVIGILITIGTLFL